MTGMEKRVSAALATSRCVEGLYRWHRALDESCEAAGASLATEATIYRLSDGPTLCAILESLESR